MTADQVIKLDGIKHVKDLIWRRESYDAGHPNCLCSACGERVKDSEEFEDCECGGYEFGMCKEDDDNFPIRLWEGEGKGMIEAVIHKACFTYLLERGIISMR